MFSTLTRHLAKSAPDYRHAALDALQGNVMLADTDLTITYLNPTLRILLEEAEAELKRELPRFDVARLIGSNIDVFHKNPSHQRVMLKVMEATHRATIRVGTRVFDLVITPLREGLERVGFVVEWSDARARLLNLDYAGKMAAISRTQAIVEFTPDGTIIDANEVFLALLGYRLEELRGKPHSIFVEPDYRASAAYKAFWTDLGHGRFQAGRFKRLGKGGEPVWIEGAYNPILDENGRVAKVVKFATNVTAQANLLAELYRNFDDIDRAIQRSEAEGASALAAADATLSRVQTVATGTEQLAQSISQIAGTMAGTQAVADRASERAVEVDASTNKLATATREMSGIVDLIGNVAGQINLLALNATIEAARAGDAGRGFAVVAAEVKSLAKQSADATQRISREIEGIQATSEEVALAARNIRAAIEEVRGYVVTTAAAMEEQDAVTGGISSDMTSATQTLSTTTQNISGITAAVTEVALAINKTKEAAKILAA